MWMFARRLKLHQINHDPNLQFGDVMAKELGDRLFGNAEKLQRLLSMRSRGIEKSMSFSAKRSA